MVKSCLVATCKNTQGVAGITFHKIGKKRYANRLKAIGRSADENLSPQNVICSKHFAEEDFIYFNGKKYLKIEALPRLFLPRRPSVEQKIDDIDDRITLDDVIEVISNPLSMDSLNLGFKNETWVVYSDTEYLFITPEANNTKRNDQIISPSDTSVNTITTPVQDVDSPGDAKNDEFDIEKFFNLD